MLPFYVLVTGPSAEPLTDDELLNFTKVDSADLSLVQMFAAMAREYVEGQTGRAVLSQTWKLVRSSWPSPKIDDGRLYLERTPLASVTSVKYYPADSTAQATLSTSVYRVVLGGDDRPGFIELVDGQSWPDLAARSDAVEVEFEAGADDAANVPHGIKHAILLLTKHYYDAGRDPVNLGNIVTEIPYTLRDVIGSKRVGGWCA